MPTLGFDQRPMNIDPRRWQRCMEKAEASMIAEGRHPRSLCPKVKLKRAYRFWRAS